MRHFTIHHDGVTIPVSRGGQGRPLVLCPGLSSTQADLRELLRRDHDVVTFDLRGHGLASAASHAGSPRSWAIQPGVSKRTGRVPTRTDRWASRVLSSAAPIRSPHWSRSSSKMASPWRITS